MKRVTVDSDEPIEVSWGFSELGISKSDIRQTLIQASLELNGKRFYTVNNSSVGGIIVDIATRKITANFDTSKLRKTMHKVVVEVTSPKGEVTVEETHVINFPVIPVLR